MQILRSGACVERFFQQLPAASSRWLLVDYDGTLARFRAERDLAFPYPRVAQLLDRILEECGTRVVVVTGRRARDIVPLLQLRHPIEIWGAHGHEHLGLDGSCALTEAARARAEILGRAAQWVEREGLSAALERKPGAVALHWRGLPPPAVHEIRTCGYRAWSWLASQPDLQLVEFDGGLELRVSRPNKGDVVASLLEGNGAVCAYLGDDISDEEAFAAVAGRGLSVLVRPQLRPTRADLWLQPPAELVGFLQLWIRACGREA